MIDFEQKKAVEVLSELIEKRAIILDELPSFLTEEREDILMEINSFRQHILWLQRGAM